ncbi:MAG TPA: hypothetical protein VKE94_13725, partial [Gemmataceae bacterium]|nr:hypothetical protein [Gemmataceae bacterium]
VCLRWQLLRLADRIEDGQMDLGTRVLIVNERVDQGPAGAPEPRPELPSMLARESYPTGGWRLQSQRRFSASLRDDPKRPFRFFCDVYACERIR